VVLGGRSTTWQGGGVVVTEETLADCRQLIEHQVSVARFAPQATELRWRSGRLAAG
jgi:hypothetical protein